MASFHPPASGSDQQETLLEFPCRFPIKAMGRNAGGFEVLVTKIISAHADIFAQVPVKTSPSSSGNYLSVTVTIEAVSKAQLDRIYRELTDCEHVLVAL